MPVRARGFSLIEILMVITIIAVLMGLVLPVVGRGMINARVNVAQTQIKLFAMALAQYRSNWDAFPPEAINGAPVSGRDAGGAILYYHLCTRFPRGEGVEDALLAPNPDYVRERGNSKQREFFSPLGNNYIYYVDVVPNTTRTRCMVIDAGRDKKLGGSIVPEKGFVPDGSGEDKDNLYVNLP